MIGRPARISRGGTEMTEVTRPVKSWKASAMGWKEVAEERAGALRRIAGSVSRGECECCAEKDRIALDALPAEDN